MTPVGSIHRTTEFFPGVFDSDGRPWTRFSGGNSQYEAALSSALKIALLSQKRIYLPIGYLLDNPPLQRIVLRHSGDAPEAQAFQHVMRDAVRIANGGAPAHSLEPLTDWQAHTRNWVKGFNSNRGQKVYLNGLDPDDAERAQRLSLEDFMQEMSLALRQKWDIEFSDLLAACNRMGLRPASQQPFEFHSFVQDRLISGADVVSQFHGPVRDKVLSIVDACSQQQVRLSRSLLNNWKLCRSQLGVPGLTRIEYESLVPVFGHYHHLAFAKSLGLAAIATPWAPPTHNTAAQLVRAELEKAEKSLGLRTLQAFPLSRISFEDIFRVRLGKNQIRFNTNLDAIHDAIVSNGADAWKSALRAHARNVASVVSLRFTETKGLDVPQLAGTLTEYTKTHSLKPESAVNLARLTFTLFREFIPNIHRELQVRWFFRQLE